MRTDLPVFAPHVDLLPYEDKLEARPLEQTVMHAARTNASHAVAFGTEAGVFQEAGIPAIICGPGHIAQAHQADEYLEVSEFEAGQRFMERLLERCA